MNVQPISFSSNKSTYGVTGIKDAAQNPFVYTSDKKFKENDMGQRAYFTMAGLLALGAVGVTLVRIRGKKILPQSIVDLINPELGLNKLDPGRFGKTAAKLKEKVIYPLKAAKLDDPSFIHPDTFKSGVLLTDSNSADLEMVSKAFMEHARENGFRCISMPERFTKKSECSKWLQSEVIKADSNYRSSKEYTFIELGDLKKITAITAEKNEHNLSNVEQMMLSMTEKKYDGAVWVAWTDAPQSSIPTYYYYKDLPVMVSKLVGA